MAMSATSGQILFPGITNTNNPTISNSATSSATSSNTNNDSDTLINSPTNMNTNTSGRRKREARGRNTNISGRVDDKEEANGKTEYSIAERKNERQAISNKGVSKK